MGRQEKLDELKKIKFPNDEEVEEILKLEEEINLAKKESCKEEIPRQKKQSLLEIIIKKFKKKPVTFAEIERLRNERTVAYLKRDIAKANYERKNPVGKRREARNTKIESAFGNKSSSDGGLSKMIGRNDLKKYKGLIP